MLCWGGILWLKGVKVLLMSSYAGVFRVNNSGVVDLSDGNYHPLILRYAEVFRESLHKVSLDHGRVLPGFSLKKKPPFKMACDRVTEFSSLDSVESVLREQLKIAYRNYSPKCFSDFFDIDFVNERLRACEPWAGVLPWRARGLEGYRERIIEGTLLDNLKQGYPDTAIEEGWAYCGPVSNKKVDIEAERLAALMISIKSIGYKRNFSRDGDIVATALVDESYEWRWLVTSGHHRACVVASLGFQSVDVRINNVVLRGECMFWPHVVDGLFTPSEALKVFDNIFNGMK